MTIYISYGQQFSLKTKFKLEEQLSEIKVEWIALDEDTLLDFVVVGVSADQTFNLITFRNEGENQFSQKNSYTTVFKEATIHPYDWNNDDKIDILLTGITKTNDSTVIVMENKSNFLFNQNEYIELNLMGLVAITDLNHNGRKEFVQVKKQNSTGTLTILESYADRVDTVFKLHGIGISDIEIADFDRTGNTDLLISGDSIDGKPTLLLLKHKENFEFSYYSFPEVVSGDISTIDYNGDGLNDVVATGKDEFNYFVHKIWLNTGDGFRVNKIFPSWKNTKLFVADLNANGLPDHNLQGSDTNEKPINLIRHYFDDNIRLDTSGLKTQSFGDADSDGDLDLLQIVDSLRYPWIKLYSFENSGLNKAPEAPPVAYAISLLNKTFLIWRAGQDDLTPVQSLTYDVWLGNAQLTRITSNFNKSTKKRMIVARGRVGSITAFQFNGTTTEQDRLEIQTVDNAFNGSKRVCKVNITPCFNLITEKVQACKEETLTLKEQTSVHWFSLSKGYMGKDNELHFNAIKSDTLLSISLEQATCLQSKIWYVKVNENFTKEKQTIYACENEKVKVGITPGWQSIVWNTTPEQRNIDTLTLEVTNEFLLTVTAQSTLGCSYQKEFTIRLSKPDLSVHSQTTTILKGNTIQLTALSSATNFKWQPAQSLSDNAIYNPLATPLETTTYQVSVTDSIGCVNIASIELEVKQTAFIPTLFSPNLDGKNDTFYIYGLDNTKQFHFIIYNREGLIVFETTDVLQATTIGWDGYTKNSLQPSGVYFWRVSGTTNDNESILLNGKKEGTLLIVH
ncbi:MAG: gliding motility-associated C-terminal domain-containing protein [Chryseotalea sp.]